VRSLPIGQPWCHLPLRIASEVVDALIDEADRRYLSPSHLVEQLLREALPRLANERVTRKLRPMRGGLSPIPRSEQERGGP
jgi:hypothetical protein